MKSVLKLYVRREDNNVDFLLLATSMTSSRTHFFVYRENHQITPRLRLVGLSGRQYRTSTDWKLYVPSIAQVPGLAVSRLNGSRDLGRKPTSMQWPLTKLVLQIYFDALTPRKILLLHLYAATHMLWHGTASDTNTRVRRTTPLLRICYDATAPRNVCVTHVCTTTPLHSTTLCYGTQRIYYDSVTTTRLRHVTRLRMCYDAATPRNASTNVLRRGYAALRGCYDTATVRNAAATSLLREVNVYWVTAKPEVSGVIAGSGKDLLVSVSKCSAVASLQDGDKKIV